MSSPNNKLAIIMTSNGWGGLEMNTMKLAEALSAQGIEVLNIVAENTKYAKSAKSKFEHIVYLRKPRKYFDFKNAKRLWHQLKKRNIKNVLVPFRADLDLVAITKRKSGNHLHIIHQQHMAMDITKTGITQRYRYRAIDVWLCPLKILKADVLKNTEVPEHKIRIAPIGIHIETFKIPKISKKEAQKIIGCETEAKLIGVIGRIDEKKGQLFLAKALKKLREVEQNVELLIVGTPTLNDPKGNKYFDEIKSFVVENELTKYIHFANFIDDVNLCFSAIDILAMPSERETYGMVTLEAMLSRVPVIGTNAGGTPEILEFGNYGELYEVNDLDDFVIHFQNLEHRISNDTLNLDFVQSEIAKKYSIEQEVSAVLDAMV